MSWLKRFVEWLLRLLGIGQPDGEPPMAARDFTVEIDDGYSNSNME